MNNNDLLQRTSSRASSLARRIQFYQTKLETFRSFRLTTAAVWFLTVTATTFFQIEIATLIATVLFLFVFIPLVLATKTLDNFIRDLGCLKDFYNKLYLCHQGRSSLSEIKQHLFAHQPGTLFLKDLDFGKPHGVLGVVDKTFSKQGYLSLVDLLKTGLAGDPNRIPDKHKTYLVAEKHWWLYLRSYLRANSRAKSTNSEDPIDLSYLENINKIKLLSPIQKMGILLLVCSWLVFWFLIGFLPQAAGGFFVLGLASLGFIALGHRYFRWSLEATRSLSQVYRLFIELEKIARRQPDLMPHLSKNLVSTHLRCIERWASFLSVEANPVVLLAVNFVSPWSAFFSYQLNREIQKTSWPLILKEVHELEILFSFVFLKRFHGAQFPIVGEALNFECTNMIHPLIDVEQVVANSFCLENPEGQSTEWTSSGKVNLITGSNMSGKSTFLRSLGINQVLACAGAPVFADKFQTSFGKVLTCIEVSDSVTTGISHFYAEVLRVKMILDEAQKSGFSIILIDEIFRGTNNRERFLGAQAIIQFLTQQQNVVSFITTHDIELATQKGISNFHFRDEVHEDKMVFVYKIFKGPCSTTNALRLMQMSGLPVSF